MGFLIPVADFRDSGCPTEVSGFGDNVGEGCALSSELGGRVGDDRNRLLTTGNRQWVPPPLFGS